MKPRYVYDPKKSETTRKEKGFGFELMEQFDWNWALLDEDDARYHEQRFTAIGPIADDLYYVVYADWSLTDEEDVVRVISLSRADSEQRKVWKNEFQ